MDLTGLSITGLIDRDYDGVLPPVKPTPKKLFVTDYYYIESYFIERPCLEGMLGRVIGIPPESGVADRLLSEIEQTLADFANSIRAISACILAVKSKGGFVEQEKISVHTCFSFDRDCRARRVLGRRAVVLRGLGLGVSLKEYREWHKKLKSSDQRYWVRGKLFLWLLRNLLLRAAEAAQSLIDPERRQYRFSIAPLQGHGIYLFAGQYAEIPQRLVRYVERTRARRRS